MKLPLLAAMAVCGCLAPLASAENDSFRLVSWNIQWFPGRIPDAPQEAVEEHKKKTLARIQELQPDVLFLQEIRDWKSAKYLTDGVPGMHLHLVSDFPERTQNLVIASKFPADSAWVESFSHGDEEGPPRGFAFAAIRLPQDHILLAYSVHLKSNRGEEAQNFAMRQESARQLLRHVEKMRELYSKYARCSVLIGGDFNTTMDDARFVREKTLRAFQDAGLKWNHAGIPFRQRITIPAMGPFPSNCFDHVFYSGLTLQRSEVPQFPEESDHNPVVVDFELPKLAATPLELGKIEDLQTVIPAPPPAVVQENEIVDASDVELLRRLENQEIRVRGKVERVGRSPSGHLIFINFSKGRGGFTAIVRRTEHITFEAHLGGPAEKVLPGKDLTLLGVITLYRGEPQMEIAGEENILEGIEKNN